VETPELAKEFIRQYDTATRDVSKASSIHRVSHYLAIDALGCLGSDLREFAAGGLMSPRLRAEITAYQLCMLDDSCVEGPHARIGRVTRSSGRVSPPFWSATCRLQQNIAARRNADSLCPGRFAWFFDRWKMHGQRRKRNYDRGQPQRIRTGNFCSTVYRTHEAALENWEALGQRRLAIEHDDASRMRSGTVRQIQLDWIACVFRPGKTFSASSNTHGMQALENMASGAVAAEEAVSEGSGRIVFQVVSDKLVWKKHVSSPTVLDWRRKACPVMIQNFGQCSPIDESSGSAEVYHEGYPEVVDLFHLVTWKNLMKACEWQCEDVGSDGADESCVFRLHLPVLVDSMTWRSVLTVW